MAKSGRSVLLLDADMRNPGVAELLGLENSVGLVTVLLGRASIEQAVQEHSSGVNFLGTGPLRANALAAGGRHGRRRRDVDDAWPRL